MLIIQQPEYFVSMCSLHMRAARPSYWHFELNLPRRRRGQIPTKEVEDQGLK